MIQLLGLLLLLSCCSCTSYVLLVYVCVGLQDIVTARVLTVILSVDGQLVYEEYFIDLCKMFYG